MKIRVEFDSEDIGGVLFEEIRRLEMELGVTPDQFSTHEEIYGTGLVYLTSFLQGRLKIVQEAEVRR